MLIVTYSSLLVGEASRQTLIKLNIVMTYSEKALLKAQCKIEHLADGNLSVGSMQNICLDCYDGENGGLGSFIDEATKNVRLISSGYVKIN